MTICLPPPSASAYRLVDDLREPMGIASVHRVAVDDLAIEQSVFSVTCSPSLPPDEWYIQISPAPSERSLTKWRRA